MHPDPCFFEPLYWRTHCSAQDGRPAFAATAAAAAHAAALPTLATSRGEMRQESGAERVEDFGVAKGYIGPPVPFDQLFGGGFPY